MPIELRDRPKKLEKSSSVWRYVEISAAIDTLARNQLRFTQLNVLKDEWEGRRGPASRKMLNELEDAIALDSGLRFPAFERRYSLEESLLRYFNYVSSWTTHSPDFMVMWLAYAKSPSFVALQSTVEQLEKGLINVPDVSSIGLVDYIDQHVDAPYGLDFREEIYRKRKAFSFENEVRFVIDRTHNRENGNFKLADEPSHVFEEIQPGTISSLILHPQAPEGSEEMLELLNSNLTWGITVSRSTISEKPIN